jgi:hypothetical protein
MLEEKGHSLTLYDPFFKPNTNALKRNYDFVFATEVIEHFFHPALEFQRLRALTKPGGLGNDRLRAFNSCYPRTYPARRGISCPSASRSARRSKSIEGGPANERTKRKVKSSNVKSRYGGGEE